MSRSIFCPAKINPFLAVTGRREDGFHALVSLVVPLPVGDELTVTCRAEPGFALTCSDETLPTDGSNLVIKAAQAFAEASGWRGGADFELKKTLPSGAGLGGGSSDAVGALRALNALTGMPLDEARLTDVAAGVGSDCPLFLHGGPVVMRGRGEVVTPLTGVEAARWRGHDLVLLKPPFGIDTAWAYGRLAAGAPDTYWAESAAEAALAAWEKQSEAGPDAVSFNSFWPVVAAKHVALAALKDRLREELGLALHLSGSGSACFVWVQDAAQAEQVLTVANNAWGQHMWSRIVRL